MPTTWRMGVPDLDRLLGLLRGRGRTVVGPTARDGAIVYDELASVRELPVGLSDEQEAGRYRLVPRADRALFAYNLGPGSWKGWLFPARVTLWTARRQGQGFTVDSTRPTPTALALLGPRACELAAIAIQDRVLLRGHGPDPTYASRRADLLVIAVQCGRAAATCFCPSTGSGPRVQAGFDLCLTEILGDEIPGEDHHLVVEVGSPAGQELVEALGLAATGDPQAPARAAEAATARMRRHLPEATTDQGLRPRLLQALEGPHWDAVAQRCLGCANCTMVCPTCFCTEVTDTTDLAGLARRERTWDSCFSLGHSHVHGAGPVRADLGQRYRQWLTHKLATWWDQFGTSGCVGCGRCVAWCPAGIDIVAEARDIVAGEPAAANPEAP